jgi:SAM-dependent methyltransferase
MHCSDCARSVALIGGIADFVSEQLPRARAADRYRCVTHGGGLGSNLPTQIKSAAGSRWPASLGDVVEFGCGPGSMAEDIVSGETVRSLLVVDTNLSVLQACQRRIADLDSACPIFFAALGDGHAAIRDAIADTVVGSTMLLGIGDTRAFLTMVHRVMKTGGRALFVVPNRRYCQAICLAMADALTQRYARDGTWSEGCGPVLTLLEETRRLLVLGNLEFPNSLEATHLFDSDTLQDLGSQVGFCTADVIPLDPDPAGGRAITWLCKDAGATHDFAREFGSLAATVGHPYLSLLNYRDASAFSLLWLTKAAGPTVCIFSDRLARTPPVTVDPDVAVGGVLPRWSVELPARDTPDGVVVEVGGWCLSNIDAKWVRITLDSVAQTAPVWRRRPDVHEVLNRARVYHSLNALCSGLEAILLFAGVHPMDAGCTLRVEIVLAGDLIVTGPAPEMLLMDQPTVIAH